MTAYARRHARIRFVIPAGLLGIGISLWVANSSWLWEASPGRPTLLAHRGVAQQFRRDGLTNETCTAARMTTPVHGFLENTIPSIAKAFELGADLVEIDVHPTTDGEIAVFHDWTLDCRTDGHGVTRSKPMSYLKGLDIGYGYTADEGKTHPFRGKYVGAMPTLSEVLRAFPSRQLLINLKSNDAREADLVVSYLRRGKHDVRRLSFYGGDRPIERLRALLPTSKMISKGQLRDCLLNYVAIGWSGRVPPACRYAIIFVPINYKGLMWGWPSLFVDRLARVNSQVFLVGPLTSETNQSGSTAIDDPRVAERLVEGYRGGLSTDRIDLVGPTVRRRTVYVD